jgi:hypothetical protein
MPKDRGPRSKIFEFFDRFVVTWLFTIFDILILLPALIWIALAAAESVLVPAARIITALWRLTLHSFPWNVHIVGHWIRLLTVSLLRYLHWLQYVG